MATHSPAKNVLVLGGYGAVGASVTRQLRERGHSVRTAGRDADRVDTALDITDSSSAAAAAKGADLVINATGSEDPELASAVTEPGAAFVDITATNSYISALSARQFQAPVLVSVGIAPGLTNLLAARMHRNSPGPIDIIVALGAGEHHGAAATEWTARLVGSSFSDHGTRVRNFSAPVIVEVPGYGRRRVYRADFSDQHILSREFQTPVRSYFMLDSRLATGGLALLTRLPWAPKLTSGKPLPRTTDRWLVLARTHLGAISYISGRGQSHATATVTASVADFTERLEPGLQHLHHVVGLDEIARATGFKVEERNKLTRNGTDA
ncbi:NAD(P)H-binding protein [Hoyosella altamirensis]|uniref:NAD(P)-dependent dehydrogenase (Short-subunit alcohol dehydrogenase family) n=1 Tax=Hoyosella altamirensis TaxID=616997 RepID=A0A839RNM9_9ACTN|nr:NAD-dependent epimerase/dehydratase family protein [Hoyosella altamirensis]MBB3037541.1 NAD(P)-dependent dehydrogenase (short-subunit alcohol dehydrogenase family) [Hoyosella altamirensis]